MSQWVEVARIDDIPPGHAARLEIDTVAVAVFNVDGTFHAVDDTCTHAEASLSEGELVPGRCAVECPLHGAVFDLRSGEPLALPATEPVRVHRTAVSDGSLRVALSDD